MLLYMRNDGGPFDVLRELKAVIGWSLSM
jgi:hypothetical protein